MHIPKQLSLSSPPSSMPLRFGIIGFVGSKFIQPHLVLVFGTIKYLQPEWPCQKQPCTKITVRHLGKTISGLPGPHPRLCICRFYLRHVVAAGFFIMNPAIQRDRLLAML